MPYLDAYLQNIIDRGNLKLAESVKETAENVGNKYLKTFSFTEHKIGLLLGNIQSGKTGQCLALCAKPQILDFLSLYC